MEMDRAEKERVIANLGEIFSNSDIFVVAHYNGMTVKEITELRTRMREVGGTVQIAKNGLARIAAQRLGTSTVRGLFFGEQPSLIASASDPISGLTVLKAFSDDNLAFKIIGGASRDHTYSPGELFCIAEMPSRDVLLRQIASMIGAPAASISGILDLRSGNCNIADVRPASRSRRSESQSAKPPDFSKLFHKVQKNLVGVDLSFDAFESISP
jgi:large subunit ribosomal protein L10